MMNKFVLSSIVVGGVSVAIITGITYANTIQTWVSNVWHDPQLWAQNDAVIPAQQIAEDFNYLKNRVDTLNTLIASSTATSSAPIINGCKLRYRVQTDTGTSPWVETPWGGTSGTYQVGAWASMPGSITSFKYQLGVLCETGSALQFAYRYRGNHGEYGNTFMTDALIANSSADTLIDGEWTTSAGKSCYADGGDGGCGAYIHDVSHSGSAICSTQIQLRLASTGANLTSDELSTLYGSYDHDLGSGCNGAGCGIRADIRCVGNSPTNLSTCPTGKKLSICFAYANETAGKRCASVGATGFQWNASWPPTVSMECQ